MPPLTVLFFLSIEHSVLMVLVFNEKYRLGNDAKNSAIRRVFFVIERTQLNAAHA